MFGFVFGGLVTLPFIWVVGFCVFSGFAVLFCLIAGWDLFDWFVFFAIVWFRLFWTFDFGWVGC